MAVEDVPWVARVLGMQIRVTIECGTWKSIVQTGVKVPEDFWTGPATSQNDGGVPVHLLFSWRCFSGGRSVGHWDLLQPRCQQLFSILLPPDATWLLF